MAEESGGDGWWSAWGSEFLSNVKAKSAETFSLVKQDLSEFVTTIQYDTTVTAAETAHRVKEQLEVEEDETDDSTTAVIRQGVSQWLGSISTALRENVSQLTAIIDEEPTSIQPGLVFDRAQAIVHEIQTDPATYCNDPDGHPAQYEDWCRGFDLDSQKAEISELLVNKPEIRALYTKLVPAAVTHSLFWTHYFYKMHRFEQEEKRKAALVERATKMEEEDIGWDDEDESWDVEEASKDQLLHHKPTRTQSGSVDHNEQLTPTKTHVNDQKEERSEGESIITEVQSDAVHTQESSEDSKVDQTLIKQRANQQALDVKTDIETSVGKDIGNDTEDVPKSSDPKENNPSLVTQELRNPPTIDDGPRESSTPTPRADETPQILSKHKRTASNAESEGKVDLNRENSSNSSVDSSWSKLSDEELKQSNSKKNIIDAPPRPQDGASPSHSEMSSSSVVVVPSIDDKDIDWDDDEGDLDFGDDINENESKKADTKLPDDDDDDDWENWE